MAAAKSSHLVNSERFGMVALEWVPRIKKLTDLKVFTVLCAHANSEAECYPGKKRIAELAGIDPRAVQRSLRNLEAIGAIDTTLREDNSSNYKIRPVPEAWTKCNEALRERVEELSKLAAEVTKLGIVVSFSSKVENNAKKVGTWIHYKGAPISQHHKEKIQEYVNNGMPLSLFCDTFKKAQKQQQNGRTTRSHPRPQVRVKSASGGR